MKHTARSILSAIGLGLAAFTVVSFFITGFASQPTVIGLSALAIYGLFEIAALDYTARPITRRNASRRPPEPRAHKGTVVTFPTHRPVRHAA